MGICSLKRKYVPIVFIELFFAHLLKTYAPELSGMKLSTAMPPKQNEIPHTNSQFIVDMFAIFIYIILILNIKVHLPTASRHMIKNCRSPSKCRSFPLSCFASTTGVFSISGIDKYR